MTFEKDVVRLLSNLTGQPSVSIALTSHHFIDGTITPNGLHFLVVWRGVPHRLRQASPWRLDDVRGVCS